MKLALLSLAACGRAHVTSCDDDLTGRWETESGAWMVLDDPFAPEAYPLFADVPVVDGAVVAPRILELHRAPHTLVGDVHRRYMQGAKSCEARVPLHVLGCKDDTLELVLADPAPPITYAPCAWSGVPPSHREIWRR